MSSFEHYSGYEVIMAAMQVEKNGHLFYSTMAQRNDGVVSELFSWLAQDEVEHLDRLKRLAETFADDEAWGDDEFLPYLNRFRDSEIFPSAERLELVLGGADANLKLLELALEAEEKFAAYFNKASAIATSDEGRNAFTWLAQEEERHARIISARISKLTSDR